MRGDERQGRWSDAFDATGLTETCGASGDELLLDLIRKAGKAGIVEVGWQNGRIVAAVASDILGLVIKINGVFGVGLEPAHQVSGDLVKFRPDACKNSDRKLRLRREVEGRAASAVPIDHEAVRLEGLRRGGRGVEHRPSPV